MPTSKTTICNRALTKLGADRILDLSDDNKQARSLNAVYDTVLDDELSKYVWSFACARASLAALSTPPAFGFTAAYALPADYLRIVQVGQFYVIGDLSDYRGGPNPLYSIEGTSILTNLPAPLYIRYLFRNIDPMTYAPPFVELMACRLAAEIAEDLTQSNTKRQLAQAEYKEALKDARRLGAIERAPEKMPDNEWVTGRL